ncbi:ferritin [Nesidiocoris tenuis]|uniref:Ferritin n=1 Tax=Nesidiocoris tenuis TaxID=355587 RepID=A0ABN7B5V6_9HEMI|nr:ferritin [Nesidiocoris tenuis]
MLVKLAVLLLAGTVVLAIDSKDENCKPYFDQYCDKKPPYADATLKPCSPLYGAIDKRADQLRRYIKEHVSNSFEYLLQWANFNNYKKDREGFAKLYRKLSDETWDDAIELAKYLGKRGVELDFESLIYENPPQKYGVPPVGKARAESEISSLAKVLDLHKQLAISGNALHEDSIKHDNVKYASEAKEPIIQHNHDIELAHFIEEKFSGKHAQTVRDLAGHSNDLQRLLKEGGRDDKRLDATGFYVHLFDEYLRKIY